MSKSRRPPNDPPTLPPEEENKLERVVEAQQARQQGEQEALFSFRPLVMCGLPLRRIPGHVHVRRCGSYTVKIISDPTFGVPYGADRLVPIFLATAFVYLGCPQSNEIRFTYSRDFLRLFDLPDDGRYYLRTRQGFERFANSLFSFSHPIQSALGKKGVATQLVPLLRESRLWYEDSPPGGPEEPNVIRLDDRIAKELREHPIPIDLQTVRSLRDTPGALDLYQWQSWRCFPLTREVRIPLLGPSGLVAQLGCVQEQESFEIRRKLREWQQLIRLHWPECPNGLSRDGESFVLRPARALFAIHRNRFLLRDLRLFKG